MSSILVVLKRPGEPARVVQWGTPRHYQLRALLELRPGDMMGHFRHSLDVHGYCDDEGLLKGLTHNFMHGASPVAGPVVFSRLDGAGEDVGFEDEDAAEAFAKAFSEGMGRAPR